MVSRLVVPNHTMQATHAGLDADRILHAPDGRWQAHSHFELTKLGVSAIV
jgi:hypothetical protein